MAASKVLIPKICECCGEPFMAKTVTTHFCSKVCNNKSLREKKKNEEREKKLLSILQEKRQAIAEMQTRPYVSISEASSLFGISEDTIRRMVRRGTISGVNFGQRLMRVNREEMERLFTAIEVPERKEKPKNYKLDECYSIGECLKKYNIPECRLESIIKGFNIPKRQVGNYVYIPKIEIDKIMNANIK
jgi:excisionase family DNA binding protein